MPGLTLVFLDEIRNCVVRYQGQLGASGNNSVVECDLAKVEVAVIGRAMPETMPTAASSLDAGFESRFPLHLFSSSGYSSDGAVAKW